MTLCDQILSYLPWNEQEERDKQELLIWLDSGIDIYSRRCNAAHLTASAWVVSPDREKVLMAYHALYDSWAWLGGHADGMTDLQAVAEKEVREESGLTALKPLGSGIFSLEVLTVDGHEAKTEFIGHDLTSDYVRRLTRRKKTKTDHVVDVVTADRFVLRIKTMSIADRRIQASQEDAMRGVIKDFLMQYAAQNKLADVVKAIISGDLAKDTAKACHIIIPIKRIEIRKSEVLRKGEGEPESIIEAPAAEEPEAEEPAEEVPAAEEAPAENTE